MKGILFSVLLTPSGKHVLNADISIVKRAYLKHTVSSAFADKERCTKSVASERCSGVDLPFHRSILERSVTKGFWN